MYFLYIFVTLICVILFTCAYIKIKQPFWSRQPVFHLYDFHYFLHNPGIPMKELPSKNKFTNFTNIKTFKYEELSDMQIKDMLDILKNNYLHINEGLYNPKRENFIPYFANNKNAYFSLYSKPTLQQDLKKGSIENLDETIGMITSRSLNVFIREKKQNKAFKVFYVDFLCIDKLYRKSGIAPELIQTHNYNQRHIDKSISVSLFKREHELTGIVPLIKYSTYGFSVDTWHKPTPLTQPFITVKVNKSNFNIFWDFFQTHIKKFDVQINMDIYTLIELIKTDNVLIHILLYNNEIKSCYFFRKTCTFVENNLEVLSCIGSMKHSINSDIFCKGFKIAFWDIANAGNYGFAAIENISDNQFIIDNLIINNKPLVISPTAYFFYNYIFNTIESHKTFILL
jgi:hypothetical protein